MRVRVHHYELQDNEYVPFIETDAADQYRQVALVAQPGSQEAFLAAPEREVLLAGPRGTGKTLKLLTDFFAEVGAGWGANWKGVLIRQSMTGFPEIKSLCSKVIPRIWPNARFNQNQNVWTWPTGETLKFAYFDETSDYRTYIGQSFTWIGFEELTQYKNDQPYKQMLACLRSAVPNIPMRVRATTNPDGPGHNWVRRRFKTLDPNDCIIGPRIEDEQGLPRRAIYSTLAENQLLLATQPDYLANIVASAIRPGQLEAWTKGSWTISSGGMFDGDWPEASKHCVLPPIPPQAIPSSWRITAAFDWGDSKPFALIWAAISDGSSIVLPSGGVLHFIRGDYVIFDELYGCHPNQPDTGVRWSIDQIKRAGIQREIDSGLRYQDPMTGRWIRRVRTGVADNMIFNPKPGSATGLADSMADEFAEPVIIGRVRQPGMQWDPADKSPGSRVQGWQAMRGMLLATIPNKNGARENPGLYVTSNCIHWNQTVPVLPRDLDVNPEDIPDRVEDHLADATRYLIRRSNKPTVRFGRLA